jgi:hypothetical protein
LDNRTELVGDVLTIPCSPEPFSFRKAKPYSVADTILVDVGASRWSIKRAG